jgi:hypothetical protein
MSIQTSSAGGFLLFRCKNYGRQVAYWHFASFRYALKFGRYRGMADIDQAALIKLD